MFCLELAKANPARRKKRSDIASHLQRIVMKSSSFPSLRVEPELRAAAESVLRDGETLSSLIETSVREAIQRRRIQEEFVARWLRSREDAECTGIYHSAESVHSELAATFGRAAQVAPGVSAAFQVRYSDSAREDLLRLFDFLLDRATSEEEFYTAQSAIDVIRAPWSEA